MITIYSPRVRVGVEVTPPWLNVGLGCVDQPMHRVQDYDEEKERGFLRRGALVVVRGLLGWFGCSNVLDEYDADVQFRAEVRAQMLLKMEYPRSDGHVVRSLADTLRRDLGYEIAPETAKDRPEDHPDNNRGLYDPLVTPVVHIPRFTATMAIHMRARLGKLENNLENSLVVCAEYRRVARYHKVHDVDIVAHEGLVLNAFFNEDVLDRASQRRRRLPAWIKAMIGPSQVGGPLVAC